MKKEEVKKEEVKKEGVKNIALDDTVKKIKEADPHHDPLYAFRLAGGQTYTLPDQYTSRTTRTHDNSLHDYASHKSPASHESSFRPFSEALPQMENAGNSDRGASLDDVINIKNVPASMRRLIGADHPLGVNEDILKTALTIVHPYTAEFQKATALFEWFMSNIQYGERKRTTEYRNAREVYEQREGICGEMSYLYIAMARAVGLQCEYVHVDLKYNGKTESHACAVVTIGNEKWFADPAMQRFESPYTNLHFYVKSDKVILDEYCYFNGKNKKKTTLFPSPVPLPVPPIPVPPPPSPLPLPIQHNTVHNTVHHTSLNLYSPNDYYQQPYHPSQHRSFLKNPSRPVAMLLALGILSAIGYPSWRAAKALTVWDGQRIESEQGRTSPYVLPLAWTDARPLQHSERQHEMQHRTQHGKNGEETTRLQKQIRPKKMKMPARQNNNARTLKGFQYHRIAYP